MSDVYNAVMKLLMNDTDGEKLKLFKNILNWKPKGESDLGFEWYEVYGDPRVLNKLVTMGILKITFKSNRSTYYMPVDREAIEMAVRDYESMMRPLAEEEEEHVEIPGDLLSIVIGHEDKKEIIFRALRSEEPVHILLYGAVASAKSLILEELRRLPRSRLVLGSYLSPAGLYDILFDERPKYLLIDEIDKIRDTSNLACLLSLMERGFISQTVHGKIRQAHLKTWVFAAANRIDRLPPELLSRFVLLKFREYTEEEFLEVTEKILVERMDIPPQLARKIGEQVMRRLGTKDPRKSIQVARLLREKNEDDLARVIMLLEKQK